MRQQSACNECRSNEGYPSQECRDCHKLDDGNWSGFEPDYDTLEERIERAVQLLVPSDIRLDRVIDALAILHRLVTRLEAQLRGSEQGAEYLDGEVKRLKDETRKLEGRLCIALEKKARMLGFRPRLSEALGYDGLGYGDAATLERVEELMALDRQHEAALEVSAKVDSAARTKAKADATSADSAPARRAFPNIGAQPVTDPDSIDAAKARIDQVTRGGDIAEARRELDGES